MANAEIATRQFGLDVFVTIELAEDEYIWGVFSEYAKAKAFADKQQEKMPEGEFVVHGFVMNEPSEEKRGLYNAKLKEEMP